MLKLLVYGYSYGVKGSRKLERECHHNLSFVWLMGGLKPDHKTIAEYRRRHKEALKKVLKQCVRLCIKLDLIAGNVLFVDGTKIERMRAEPTAMGENGMRSGSRRSTIASSNCLKTWRRPTKKKPI